MKQNTTTKQPLEDSKEGLVEICGSVVRWSDIEKVWREHCKPPTSTKEGLHTQGEWYWYDSNRDGYGVGQWIQFELATQLSDKKLDTASIGKISFTGLAGRDKDHYEKAKANAELIVKAVNERQALLDSHKELLDALKLCQYQLQTWAESDSWDTEDEAAYEKSQTAINNAKNIKQ